MGLLRQKGSGEIYVSTPELAKRDDMEPVAETPVVEEATPAEEQPSAPVEPAVEQPVAETPAE